MPEQEQNRKVAARIHAIRKWAHEWGLSETQAADKFKHQCKKWQRREVNACIR